MRVLLLSATAIEVEPMLTRLGYSNQSPDSCSGRYGDHSVECAITGIGAANMAYTLAAQITQDRPDLVLNIGICGSYRDEIHTGCVVCIGTEIWTDLGVRQEDGPLRTLEEMGFPLVQLPGEAVYNELVNPNDPERWFPGVAGELRMAVGSTVSTLLTEDKAIAAVVERWQPDVESMEGAAVFLGCLRAKIPFFEFRAVSNRVGDRDRTSWDIEGAVANLDRLVLDLLNDLSEQSSEGS